MPDSFIEDEAIQSVAEYLAGSAFDADINPYLTEQDEVASFPSERMKILPVADEHGHQLHYPGEDEISKAESVQVDGADDPEEAPGACASSSLSILDRFVSGIRLTYSLALLVFSLILVMVAMFTKQTYATSTEAGVPAWAACIIFWFLIWWLAMMEGGLGCLVGLRSIANDRYEETHLITLKNTALIHQGQNMERFIVGRQFLLVLVVFFSNVMAGSIEGTNVLGLPHIITEIFLESGIALILVTIILGQLTAQVNAARCMLDFVNNYFMLYFVTNISLAIEFSGLLHSVYLVQILFSKISGKPLDSNDPPRTKAQSVFFWARILMSMGILGFALAVTVAALLQGKTAMWAGIPPGVAILIFLLIMCFVGMLEGIQIALFSVVNMPEETLRQHKMAYKNCELAFRSQNLQAFLIGRQICVTTCMFVAARVCTLTTEVGTGSNIFGVSNIVQQFFNTGLLGAVVITIIGSLNWRVVASSFPVAFMSNPLIYVMIRLCFVVEASGLASAAWITGRYNKIITGMQPDDVYLHGAEPHTREPVTRRDKDVDVTVDFIKYIYSSGLLVFSIVVVMALIFSKQTKLSEGYPSAVAFCLIWFLLLWLSTMEGGLGCLVGLQGVQEKNFDTSHPQTLKNCAISHKGDNMARVIVGRQFLVVLVVFLTNMSGAALPGSAVFNLPDSVSGIFVGSGVAMILMTIVLGQLTAQVNAANSMVDFINNRFMLYFVTYVSLAIEFSGLLHCVYLVNMAFAKITGQAVASKEPPRSTRQNLFFWSKVIMSFAILIVAFVVTLKALFEGKTTAWDGTPAAVSVILFFVLMLFAGLLDGMQIALFTVVNLPQEELAKHKAAKANCDLVFAGSNLQAFLIGRQICVTICTFIVARVSTMNVTIGVDGNIFEVSDGLQNFFNTGLLSAVITTIVGSLAWRIAAASFPIAFISNPLVTLTIRLCLLLEASGLCSSAWLLAGLFRRLRGYKSDDAYLVDSEKEDTDGIDDVELQTVPHHVTEEDNEEEVLQV